MTLNAPHVSGYSEYINEKERDVSLSYRVGKLALLTMLTEVLE